MEILLFMESGSGRTWFVGLVIVLVIGFGYAGWRGMNPDHDAFGKLSDMSIDRGDPLTFTLTNSGRKAMIFGHPYEIWKDTGDGKMDLVELDVVWIAEIIELKKGETWSQEVFTDLEPGKYVFVKSWLAEDGDPGSYAIDLTIR